MNKRLATGWQFGNKSDKPYLVFCSFKLQSNLYPFWIENLVFYYQNVLAYKSRKTFEFEAEGREFANIFISLEQFVQTVKGQNNFWQQNDFLTCSWRFLRSNKLEQLEFKLEKNIWIWKHAGT